MTIILKFLMVGISLLMFKSCGKDDSAPKPVSSSINKIMSLGASRVEGNRPEYESFRYELWKDLTENGWEFDYIGTQSDEATYPIFNNRDFDIDHEGRAGWTSGQILNDIDNWLAETGAPDIVLFSSPGGNDALENLPYNQALTNINGIVDALQNANPEITIVIEQLAPARSDLMTADLTTYFNQLKQGISAVASENSTASSEVIAVDMFTGFTDNLLSDDVHYNEAGADFIARRYYVILENVLEE
jgi:lysophospholipase L1-like esterase